MCMASPSRGARMSRCTMSQILTHTCDIWNTELLIESNASWVIWVGHFWGGNNSNSANYNWSKVSHITFPWGFLLIQSDYSHNILLLLVKPQQQLGVLELWGEEGRVQPGRYPFSNHFKHQFNANHPAWVLSNGQRGGRRRWQLSHSDAPK